MGGFWRRDKPWRSIHLLFKSPSCISPNFLIIINPTHPRACMLIKIEYHRTKIFRVPNQISNITMKSDSGWPITIHGAVLFRAPLHHGYDHITFVKTVTSVKYWVASVTEGNVYCINIVERLHIRRGCTGLQHALPLAIRYLMIVLSKAAAELHITLPKAFSDANDLSVSYIPELWC